MSILVSVVVGLLWLAAFTALVWRVGIAGLWDVMKRVMQTGTRVLMHGHTQTVFDLQPAPPSMFPTWDEYLDRLAADVHGTDMDALVAAAEDRAEGGEPPPWEPLMASLLPQLDYDDAPRKRPVPPGPGAASPKPAPLLHIDAAAPVERIEAACRYAATRYGSRPVVLPSNVEYIPLCAETESVHWHHSHTPVRTFVTGCAECGWEVNRRTLIDETRRDLRCRHSTPLVEIDVLDPDSGEHLGEVPACPDCYQDATGEPPQPPAKHTHH